MNQEQFERNWSRIKVEVHTKWTDLTADRMEAMECSKESLICLLQETYGYSEARATSAIDRVLRSLDSQSVFAELRGEVENRWGGLKEKVLDAQNRLKDQTSPHEARYGDRRNDISGSSYLTPFRGFGRTQLEITI